MACLKMKILLVTSIPKERKKLKQKQKKNPLQFWRIENQPTMTVNLCKDFKYSKEKEWWVATFNSTDLFASE